MPQSLDESTQRVILLVSTFTTILIGLPALYTEIVLIPNSRRRLLKASSMTTKRRHSNNNFHIYENYREDKRSWTLFVGVVASMMLMAIATTILAYPVLSWKYEKPDDDDVTSIESTTSSSINFCEEDFQHTAYIAEPVNTISSVTCYVPLALLGLYGPPSTQYYGKTKRFTIINYTLLAIGFGSTALHCLLTAHAQGGDELPMLWYTACATFCSLDIILWEFNVTKRNTGSWRLSVLVLFSAIAATITYINGREDFTVFYIMFSIYANITILSILYIIFCLNWEKSEQSSSSSSENEDNDEDTNNRRNGVDTNKNNNNNGNEKDPLDGVYFKAEVLYPLAAAVAWVLLVSLWVWISEMLYCNAVLKDQIFGTTGIFATIIAPMLLNRVVHAVWHFGSGMLAWLLIQLLVASFGMQQNWGIPVLHWYGAPYVMFHNSNTNGPPLPPPTTTTSDNKKDD